MGVAGRGMRMLVREHRLFGALVLINSIPFVLLDASGSLAVSAVNAARYVAFVPPGLVTSALVAMFFILPLYLFSAAAVAALELGRNGRPELAHCLRRAIAGLPASVLQVVSVVLTVFVGLIVLVLLMFAAPLLVIGVPLFVWALVAVLVRYWLLVPIRLAEGEGIGHALRRSRHLIERNKAKVAGLLAVLILLWIVYALLLGYLANQASLVVANVLPAFDAMPLWYLPVQVVANALPLVFVALAGIYAALTYDELRHLRDGPDYDPVLRVFD